MVELLGSGGGKVAVLGGRAAASNAQERVRGVVDAFKGTAVEVAFQAYDDIDFDNDVPRQIVIDAVTDHPDLDGIIGIYAYNGPIAMGVLEDRKLTGSLKLVAFDLDAQTIAGLKNGTVDAALGQRPYWMGYLSVYILYAMSALGEDATMDLLAPWLGGERGDLFDSGHDVVTPENIDQYEAYLSSLGLSNS
jgi:ribose transport system substrate-binding protein